MFVAVGAAAITLLYAEIGFNWPVEIELPGWLATLAPFLLMLLLLVSIGMWIWAWVMLSMPSDVRRGLAFARFAKSVDLNYMRNGFAPERLGVFFAERLPGPNSRFSRRRQIEADTKALYRTEFTLWEGQLWRGNVADPSMQLGTASFSGGKSDPKGPRNAFRYLTMRLPRSLPHLVIDARGNGSLRAYLPGTERLSLEGDFDRYFTVYAPHGYERDALELLTPDVMACLIDHGRAWDIEVIDNRLHLASSRVRPRTDRREVPAMLFFARLVGEELAHQAQSYTDPRARQPHAEIGVGGRRLRRRSGAWETVGFGIFVAVMVGFPMLLRWVLDVT